VNFYYDDNPYVSVAARRARAAVELAALEKEGRRVSPVTVEGRKIASTSGARRGAPISNDTAIMPTVFRVAARTSAMAL